MAIKFKVKGSNKEVIFPDFKFLVNSDKKHVYLGITKESPYKNSFEEDNNDIFTEGDTVFIESSEYIFAFNLSNYANNTPSPSFSLSIVFLDENEKMITQEYNVYHLCQ